jgi:hypothetical protein
MSWSKEMLAEALPIIREEIDSCNNRIQEARFNSTDCTVLLDAREKLDGMYIILDNLLLVRTVYAQASDARLAIRQEHVFCDADIHDAQRIGDSSTCDALLRARDELTARESVLEAGEECDCDGEECDYADLGGRVLIEPKSVWLSTVK